MLAHQPSRGGAPTVTLAASPAEPGAVDCTLVWADDAPLVVDAVQMFQSLGVRVARHTTNAGAEHYVLLDWPGDVDENGDLFREALRAIHSRRSRA
ncbi:hypothetical protein [Nocardioides sp. B-3]|uniref:hypothetical protein n=1 Tax=Nocardioides sp. B-3 TaxID=2895565 RepID=UPI002152C455|nr:hypothetical protein [Nocardioides sp. B-3]UUZ60201.1 hypothetical protein LP418_04470 [Nocardioides sp. B-3]